MAASAAQLPIDTGMHSGPSTRLLLNEPDREPGRLLEALLEATEAVPSGESIAVAFYYLRNLRLCRALCDARRRGVNVRVLTSANTYLKGANGEALDFLRREGLADALRTRHAWSLVRRRMHLKLFLATRSGALENVVMFGSYNPSSNEDDTDQIYRVIGDQDRGYNFLLEFSGCPEIYGFLEGYFTSLYEPRYTLFQRQHPFTKGAVSVYPCPGRPNPFVEHLQSIASARHEEPAKLRVAVSHISETDTVDRLIELARRGHAVEVIGHDSERRFSSRTEARFVNAGISARRYAHPELYPMHCKFILSEHRTNGVTRRDLFAGSMNLKHKSYYLHDDLLVRFSDHPLYDEFLNLWGRISDNRACVSIKGTGEGMWPAIP